jgi:hypothetical protein
VNTVMNIKFHTIRGISSPDGQLQLCKKALSVSRQRAHYDTEAFRYATAVINANVRLMP